jgi:hypothetical protein
MGEAMLATLRPGADHVPVKAWEVGAEQTDLTPTRLSALVWTWRAVWPSLTEGCGHLSPSTTI